MNDRKSYEKINYILRPRKQIERKIMVEILSNVSRKLTLDISKYQYIGMGSIYYYDFMLFHKYLNIKNMISIDNGYCKKRFEFNIPYDFVEFKNMETTNFLNTYKPSKNSIFWFDYDGKLIIVDKQENSCSINPSIINDLSLITKKALENDFFIISINSTIPKNVNQSFKEKKIFIERLSKYLSDTYKDPKMIVFNNHFKVIQNLILNVIKNNEEFSDLKFKKLFSFCYNDGSPMYTLGGILVKNNNDLSPIITDNDYSFLDLDEDKIINIDVPLLTYKEKIVLDSKISEIEKKLSELTPDQIIGMLDFEMKTDNLKKYIQYYKYYPQYYEGVY
jgi:hypothetical protein